MTEKSFPWDGDYGSGGTGDCGPYTSNAWDDMYRCLFTTDQHDGEGVLKGLDGELAVSGTSSPLNVAAGGAIVNGKFYRLDAATTVAVPTPTAATRIDRIVLRADYSAQTVRLARLAGTEGGGAPSLTQSDGVTWEISLAQASITTAGVITVTDEREFCHFATKIANGQLDDDAKLIAGGSIQMIYCTLGGSDGHRPVVGGVTYSNWHLCNGETVNGHPTPDLRDRFIIGAGNTYAQGATGGATTKDLTHTHGIGTLATDTAPSHAHQLQGETGMSDPAYYVQVQQVTPGFQVLTYRHTHPQQGYTVGAGSHSHALTGAMASGGSATQDIMPPYYGLYFFMYVG